MTPRQLEDHRNLLSALLHQAAEEVAELESLEKPVPRLTVFRLAIAANQIVNRPEWKARLMADPQLSQELKFAFDRAKKYHLSQVARAKQAEIEERVILSADNILHAQCSACGRTIWKEESVKSGMGEVCRKRHELGTHVYL